MEKPPQPSFPIEGRLAGIDYGTVRIGVAICDPSRTWVSPFDTLVRSTPAKEEAFFQQLKDREGIVGWVIGLPIHCDGNESQKSIEARSFAEWLTAVTGLPYRFADERFSSQQASQLLRPASLTKKKTKKSLDRVAAAIILQTFLDGRASETGRSSSFGGLED